MPEVSFGVNQIKNPTPSSLNTIVRIVTVICGVLLGWMQTAPFIPSPLQGIISSILGLIIALANGLAPLVGVNVQSTTGSTDKVTAIDEK
jgi:F0F1-type ATP synthase assembly protein I